MKRRLPPQPTNTRLARLVGRAARFCARNLRFVRRGVHDDTRRSLSALRSQYWELSRHHTELREDYRKLLRPSLTPKIERTRFEVNNDFINGPAATTSVHFQTMNVATPLDRSVRPGELYQYTREVIRHHARQIARENAVEVEEAIYSLVVRNSGTSFDKVRFR